MADELVTAQGYEVWVRCPFDRTTFWQLDFPDANRLHEALSKVLVDNMITMRAPFGPARYAEHKAEQILASVKAYLNQNTNVPALERLSALRELASGI